MDNKPVHLTLGCARFMVAVLREAIEDMESGRMKSFYKGRLAELNEAIKAAAQSQEKAE
jgi:hypothetical protein